MKYDVLCAQKIDDLVRYVNQAIAQGWHPQGGVATMENFHSTYFYQAIVTGDGEVKSSS